MPELRFLDYNYAFEDEASVTASSSDSEFPVANLKHYTRSKVWRSSGNFVIDTTNNKIDFKESGGGSQLTATLTAGSYTPSTLAAEVKAQMDAAGAETYTVAYSSATGKFTIASTGSYLSILWSSGTNNSTDAGTVLGFDATADSTGALTYTSAYITLHTGEWVLIDLLTTEDIDSFALLFDPTVGPKLTNEAVLKLQANHIDSWAAPSVDVTLSIDDDYDVITHFFSSAQSYRFWRLSIVDTKNPYLYVEVPKIILTKATQLTQMPQLGFGYTMEDRSQVSKTPYGHSFADLYPSLRKLAFEYSILSEADLKTLGQIYERLGQSFPLAVSLDSTGTMFDKDRFFIYGRFANDFQAKQIFTTYFDSTMVIEEII